MDQLRTHGLKSGPPSTRIPVGPGLPPAGSMVTSTAEPTITSAKATLIKPQVDARIEADLSFPNDIRAHVISDMLSPKLFESFIKIQGEAGEMKVINPFHPHWFHWMTIRTSKGTWRGHIKGENIYALQLRAFAKAVRGETSLNTNPNDAVNNMRVIDMIYEKAGLPLRGM